MDDQDYETFAPAQDAPNMLGQFTNMLWRVDSVKGVDIPYDVCGPLASAITAAVPGLVADGNSPDLLARFLDTLVRSHDVQGVVMEEDTCGLLAKEIYLAISRPV